METKVVTLQAITEIDPDILIHTKRHPADTKRRRVAEIAALIAFQDLFPRKQFLQNSLITLSENVSANIDLRTIDDSILIEVYSGLDNLDGAKINKITKDVLKLIFLRDHYGRFRHSELYIAVVDEKIQTILNSQKWIAKAMKKMSVKVKYIPVCPAITNILKGEKENNQSGNTMKNKQR